MIEWTDKDIEASMAQGWIVTTAYTSDYTGVQIERLDETEVFGDDYAAVAYVANQAMRGDALCQKALDYVKQEGGRLWG